MRSSKCGENSSCIRGNSEKEYDRCYFQKNSEGTCTRFSFRSPPSPKTNKKDYKNDSAYKAYNEITHLPLSSSITSLFRVLSEKLSAFPSVRYLIEPRHKPQSSASLLFRAKKKLYLYRLVRGEADRLF